MHLKKTNNYFKCIMFISPAISFYLSFTSHWKTVTLCLRYYQSIILIYFLCSSSRHSCTILCAMLCISNCYCNIFIVLVKTTGH